MGNKQLAVPRALVGLDLDALLGSLALRFGFGRANATENRTDVVDGVHEGNVNILARRLGQRLVNDGRRL